jgi:hypothetical protein
MHLPLRTRVAALLDEAVDAFAGSPQEPRLRAARARQEEPLRVAIAGKVKAGKSTLVNALVGERLAPTDAGECTRLVTWYLDSHTSRVSVEPHRGPPRQVPFVRNGVLQVSLDGLALDDIARVLVEWPSSSLRTTTLIDTPGIGSLHTPTSARTHAFLAPTDEVDTPADAVIYLMRHLHAADVRFLEAFHDQEVAQATPINTIGVLSRADEIGVGRLDAMETATRIATRYRSDPKIRRLCQTVVPIAGLLAESATTLRQEEFRAFELLATAGGGITEPLLLSADRFAAPDADVAVDGQTRRLLLERFGVFGVRLAVTLLRRRDATTAPQMAEKLLRASGLGELRRVLDSQFAARSDVLKARAGLVAVDAALRAHAVPRRAALITELERIEAGAHEFVELRLLNALRAGWVGLREDTLAAERLLGAEGTDAATRLGLEPDVTVNEIRSAALRAVEIWRGHAESPLASPGSARAASALVRTCEGLLLAAQAPTGGSPLGTRWTAGAPTQPEGV